MHVRAKYKKRKKNASSSILMNTEREQRFLRTQESRERKRVRERINKYEEFVTAYFIIV